MRKLRNHAGHFCCLATAVLVMTGGVTWGASWRENNIGLPSAVVGVRAITIDPATPSTIYVCSNSWPGDIFKSADGGGNWKAISGIVGARSVVIDPTNSSTIYAGTLHGILKSTNGGETWIGANTGLTDSSISMLAIDPLTPSTLYAVTFRSIFKSTNGGETWNAITGFPSDIAFLSLVIDPITPSTLYTVAHGVIFKSTDGGGSWNAISGVRDVRSLVIDPKNSSTIYARAFGTIPRQGIFQIFKSTDGGGSWNLINTGLPADALILTLAIDPITPSTIYAGYSDAGQGIVKSTDGGESWQVINTGLPSAEVGSLAIDPTVPSTIYAGYSGPIFRNKGGIYKSTNGGASWDAADAGLTSIDVRVLAIDPVNTAALYTAAGNAVFKSVDSGASWTKLFTFQIANATFPSLAFGADDAIVRSLLIDYIDPNVLYVETARTDGCATGDKLVFKSTDGGASWSADNGQPGACNGDVDLSGVLSLVLDPSDRNTLYVGDMTCGCLLKSTDGGASWSSVWDRPNGLDSSVWALAIDPTKPTTLYAGIQLSYLGTGGVFRTTDGGASWSSAGLGDAAVTVLAIDPANPSTLYAVTERESDYSEPQGFRGMFKSTDSGASWLPINNGLAGLIDTGSSITAFLIDPQNSNILYAGSSGGGVFRSFDSGANWSPFNDGLTDLHVRVLAVAPGNPNTLYACTAGGVFAITLVP